MPSESYKKKDPVFGVAILRVAYEMRGKSLPGYEDILKDVMKQLGVTQEELDRYIAENRQILEELCREKGLI